ncbi:DUF3460 family protein [Piscinibacter koreensis]|uniref:DUF3460 family protein n=1 Tax=Piscinibacter koreensis TaxID=2742824 RepID=A0A7Y6NPB0_9BURK|nr:DUF3460 family protein [Schlegelella koreensis]NUZ06865.1 DUF3460 family protein [Schlegelella koreensis]
MPLFWKPYTSDVDNFLWEMKQKNPQVEENQRLGRARLWERKVDEQTQTEFDQARLRQQPYVYQTKS